MGAVRAARTVNLLLHADKYLGVPDGPDPEPLGDLLQSLLLAVGEHVVGERHADRDDHGLARDDVPGQDLVQRVDRLGRGRQGQRQGDDQGGEVRRCGPVALASRFTRRHGVPRG